MLAPKSLTTLARGGLLAFVGLVAVQHPLRTDLPAQAHFVSEYASGSTELVMAGAFAAWGVGSAAAAGLAWTRGLRVLPVLLAVAAAGTFVAAGFDTQTIAGELPPGTIRTTEGRLHDQGTLGIFVGLLGSALWGLRSERTRRYRRGVAAAAAALVLAPGVLVAADLDWPGIGQRAIILVGIGVQLLLVSELSRRAPRTPARARG